MKENYVKRVFAMLLAIMMVFSVGFTSAYAQDIPEVPEQGEIETPPVVEAVNVATADELEAAIDSGAEKICIAASFELDRTFYITKNVTIYSAEAVTLTRKSDFAGDIFVIGEAEDGTVCEEKAILTVGTAGTENSDMLTIDGNKANMTATVVGTVFFVCKNGQADLHPDLTVTNCEKKGNERALDKEKHSLCGNREIIGGAVAIIAEAESTKDDGTMNIYGGKYTNNSLVSYTYTNEKGNEAMGNIYGGAFFNHGRLNVYDGIFEYNQAVERAGVFYNYRRMNIYKADISNNESGKIGGAIYLPASSGHVDLCAVLLTVIFRQRQGGGILNSGNHRITAYHIIGPMADSGDLSANGRRNM